MYQAWREYRWTVGLVGLLLMSCASMPPASLAPSPFPALRDLEPTDRAQVVQSRTTGVQTLAATLAASYTIGRQHGTFDMVVHYAVPGVLRVTAFKDTVLSASILFDLLLTGEKYRVYTHGDAGEQTYEGSVQQFAQAYPTFRTFFLLGEAFFLPGFDGQGQLPRVNATGTRLTTRLRSGVSARWFANAKTLEITQACFLWQSEAGALRLVLRYQDYRQVGDYYIPQRVTVLDRRLAFTAESVVKDVEINAPLAPGAFDVTP